MSPELGALAALYAHLSLLAIGGVVTVLPEMQREVVEARGWMRAEEFAALFALAQAAPGPNMLVATLVGWRVAGVPGALVATLAMIGPSSVLTWATSGVWHRFRDAPWRRRVQAGLVPVTAGLVMAGGALLTASTTSGWVEGLTTAATALAVLRTRWHPLWFLLAGGLLGLLRAA